MMQQKYDDIRNINSIMVRAKNRSGKSCLSMEIVNPSRASHFTSSITLTLLRIKSAITTLFFIEYSINVVYLLIQTI